MNPELIKVKFIEGLLNRVVMGPKLKVKTVAGDIMLIEECFSEVNLDF